MTLPDIIAAHREIAFLEGFTAGAGVIAGLWLVFKLMRGKR